MLLSTLSGYVEAMGGQLNLVAEFPDKPPVRRQMLEPISPGKASRAESRKVPTRRRKAATG